MIRYLLPLYEKFEPFTNYETTIEELSNTWNCSTRYAKTIIKKCYESGWVDWETYQGRGKKPQLKIKLPKLQAIFIEFDKQWQGAQYDKAYKLLHKYQLLGKPEVNTWLIDRYGFTKSDDEQDVFRYPYPKVELILDPLKGLSRHDSHIAQQIFGTLFEFCTETQQARPNLVFAYHTVDHRVWRFTLRKDVTFHDGEKLTSRDVVASLKRTMNTVFDLFTIVKIISLNSYSIEITLENPNALFPRLLCSTKMAIVSYEWIKGGEIGVPVGSGPFQLTIFKEEYMQLTAFPNYFKERPWIDVVEIIHTPAIVKFGLSTSPFDVTIPHTKKTFHEEGGDFILLNTTSHSVLQDEQLRRTVYSLINPNEYCLKEYGETVAHSFFLNADEVVVPIKDLVPGNHFPKLKIGVQQIRANVNHLREANILSERLTAYEIEHEIELAPYRTPSDQLASNYDIYIGGVALGQDRIISLLHIFQSVQFPFMTFLNGNVKGQVDELLEQILNYTDDQLVFKLFIEVEKIMQQAATIKFLSHRTHNLYIRDDSPFAGIEMETNGKIDYRKIYRIQ